MITASITLHNGQKATNTNNDFLCQHHQNKRLFNEEMTTLIALNHYRSILWTYCCINNMLSG